MTVLMKTDALEYALDSKTTERWSIDGRMEGQSYLMHNSTVGHIKFALHLQGILEGTCNVVCSYTGGVLCVEEGTSNMVLCVYVL